MPRNARELVEQILLEADVPVSEEDLLKEVQRRDPKLREDEVHEVLHGNPDTFVQVPSRHEH